MMMLFRSNLLDEYVVHQAAGYKLRSARVKKINVRHVVFLKNIYMFVHNNIKQERPYFN